MMADNIGSSLQALRTRTAKVIGVLLIGIVSNALWQYLADPLIVWLRDTLLNVTILGVTTLKDALYADIAIGLHERSASSLLGILLFGMWYGLFLLLIIVTLRLRKLHRSDGPVQEDTHNPKKSVTSHHAYSRTRRVIFIMWPATVILAIIMTFFTAQTLYTSRAIGHYQQLSALVAPYVTEEEVNIFNSRFAQIHSAQDYIALTTELEHLATANDLRIPDFRPW